MELENVIQETNCGQIEPARLGTATKLDWGHFRGKWGGDDNN